MDDPAWFPSEPPSWAEPDRAAIFAYNRTHRTGYADEDVVQDAVPVEPALSDAARRYANENRGAMEAWNAWVEENGLPYEDLRPFLMSRFDVYLPRGGALLLDVQADHLYLLATRIVVPLVASPVLPLTTGDLMPAFDVNGQRRVMASTLLFSILHRRLGPPVGNLSMHRDQITRALDLLLTGF